MTQQPSGWPFLIAAGRHRDYSILLAPGFLVQELDYGFLEGAVKPGDGQPRIVNVRTRAGRHLTVVSATHALTPADATATHDEHGRPMRLLYGFVCHHGIAEPDPADLAAALAVALEVYRRFLDHEDAPVVAAGQPFALRSALIGKPEPVSASPMPRPAHPRASITAVAVAVVLAALALILWLRPHAQTPGPCPTATVAPAADPAAAASCAPTVGGVPR